MRVVPPPISTTGRWPWRLQQAQQHDLHQAADMQAVGSAVEADVAGDDAGPQRGLQAVGVGALVDEAARGGFVEEFVAGHDVGSGLLGRRGASTGGKRMEMLRAIGLMSGASLDGVDAAWLETDGERVGRRHNPSLMTATQPTPGRSGAGGGGGLGRRHAKGAVLRLPRRARAARSGAQLSRHRRGGRSLAGRTDGGALIGPPVSRRRAPSGGGPWSCGRSPRRARR